MADNSRQSRIPMSIVSVDAAQCYDRVNHIIMSLVWFALIGVTYKPCNSIKEQVMEIQAPPQAEMDSTSWVWDKAAEGRHRLGCALAL